MRTDLLATIAATERRLGGRIERNEAGLGGLDARFDGLDGRLGGFDGRLTRLEAQQNATTERLAQLVDHFGTLLERDAERGVALGQIRESLERIRPGEPAD